MRVYSKLKGILVSFIQFYSLKLIYLITNYRKSIWINRNEGIFQIKMHSRVTY